MSNRSDFFFVSQKVGLTRMFDNCTLVSRKTRFSGLKTIFENFSRARNCDFPGVFAEKNLGHLLKMVNFCKKSWSEESWVFDEFSVKV